eukprot:CAMPEP_0119292004 /NCGR_PEP_ID=MMETSP1329-20130426/43385_1 /TAXON_ID=114041 /ORGANISM="Genus nov. species nov., Strain RCC1024" /LENGTH=59 /DNA_ID=CAMNT_0007292835 /DNA_START=52 /DNA_END=227 /DNA_ORIENTATION=-
MEQQPEQGQNGPNKAAEPKKAFVIPPVRQSYGARPPVAAAHRGKPGVGSQQRKPYGASR